MMKWLAVGALGLAFTLFAQAGGRVQGRGQNSGATGGNCIVGGVGGDEDLSTARDIDRTGFVFARMKYHTLPYFLYTREVPWHHDYPDGDTMFPDALERLTSTSTNKESFQIVDVDSKELFQYPFTYMSEPGFLDLLPNDVANLKEYFARGGFLMMDDFRGNTSNRGTGMSQWQNMEEQMAKIFPGRPIELLRPDHLIFHSFYDLDPSDMLPPYRNNDSGDVQFFGISDDQGRLLVMIDFNNDVSEYSQALDRKVCSIHEAGRAVQLEVNYAIYAMSH